MLVKVIEKGCPICEGEVKGNNRHQYFCKNCNMLFRASQLHPGGKISKILTDNKTILERMKRKEKD